MYCIAIVSNDLHCQYANTLSPLALSAQSHHPYMRPSPDDGSVMILTNLVMTNSNSHCHPRVLALPFHTPISPHTCQVIQSENRSPHIRGSSPLPFMPLIPLIWGCQCDHPRGSPRIKPPSSQPCSFNPHKRSPDRCSFPSI